MDPFLSRALPTAAAMVLCAWLGADELRAQTTFTACRVPDVGAIYMIGVEGAPSACLDESHIEFSWTEAGTLAEGSVTTTEILDGTVASVDIGADAVTSTQLADGTAAVVDLAFDPATQAELDGLAAELSTAGTLNDTGNPVDWTKLKSVPSGFADGTDDTGGTSSDVDCTGCVDDVDILDGSILSVDIADGTVGSADIAEGGVGSSEIADGAIANVDLGSDIVGGENIINGSVGTFDIANAAVTSAKLATLRDLRLVDDVSTVNGLQIVNTTADGRERIDFIDASGSQIAAIQVTNSAPSNMTLFNNRTGASVRVATGGLTRLTVAADGNIGIGTTSPSNLLTVDQGSATDPIADAWTTYSSRRWKTNIRPIRNSLEIVQRLRGVSFDWKENGDPDIGLIAEEVGAVLPEIVVFEENGEDARSLDYTRLVALLIEAVKAQQVQIEELQSTLQPSGR